MMITKDISNIPETLPLGQKLLMAGFKKITLDQMRERFCCDLISQREEDRVKNEAQKYCDSLNKNKLFFKYKVNEGNGEFYVSNSFSYKKAFVVKRCEVECCNLNTYAFDEIPQRCLDNIQIAQNLGVTDIKVFYPVMVTKQKDPIIAAILAYDSSKNLKTIVEIDYFE